MERRSNALFLILLLGLLAFGSLHAWRYLRVSLLPPLNENALDGESVASQRTAWLAFDEVLQCDVLDPCLNTMVGSGWSNPTRIAKVCGAAEDRLKALNVPDELAPRLRQNVDFLREFWLGDIGDSVNAATNLAAGKRGGVSPFAWNLDTCTSQSIPARIDQLLGVVQPGQASAKCAEIRRARRMPR